MTPDPIEPARSAETEAVHSRAHHPPASIVEPFADRIQTYMDAVRAGRVQRNLRELCEDLKEFGYAGTYNALKDWVGRRHPRPPLQAVRRVETPPGAQSQADWLQASFYFEDVQASCVVHGLLITLSHSRGMAVCWKRDTGMTSWLDGHLECYRRLGGVPAIERIDNLRAAVVSGAGPWAIFQPAFKSFARDLGFQPDACRPGTPTDKGKVERGVRTLRALGLGGPFRDLAHLQAETDRKLDRLMRRITCPATGKPVAESLEAERTLLTKLPDPPPVIFDALAVRRVAPDCTISFLGRRYSVPFVHAGRCVEARGCADGKVRIYADGKLAAEHARGTAARLVIDPAHYEGAGDGRVLPPTPLGRVSRLLARLKADGVQRRSMEIYAKVAEVLSCDRP